MIRREKYIKQIESVIDTNEKSYFLFDEIQEL